MKMDEAVRRGGANYAMDQVMKEVHARRLMPALLIALDPADGVPVLLACGAAPTEVLIELVHQISADTKTEGFTIEGPIRAEEGK